VSGLIIRSARENDVVDVVALWERASLTRPWNDPSADCRLALATRTSTVLVGHDGDALIAAVMAGFDGHRGWVYYLGVEPSRQSEGHGQAMMDAAEAWLKACGAPKMQLLVRSDNDAALGFYARLGFKKQGVVTLGKRLDGKST